PDGAIGNADSGSDSPASGESGAADGSSGDDGSASRRFCDTQSGLALCADFDEGAIADVFSGTSLSDGGTLVIDDAAAKSGPSALLTRSIPLPTLQDQ